MKSSAGRLLVLHALLAILLLFPAVAALPTTSLHIIRYAADGSTVLNETTAEYHWLEKNVPVQGDGRTHYYHQGPVFTEIREDQWDAAESKNFKDMGAVRGTAVRDLCVLAGGMQPGDEVMIKSVDGYHVEFPYGNIYEPAPRQGNLTVCWYNGEESAIGERQGTGYPPDYHVGMRLVSLADNSTNAGGRHVFGNSDMRAVMPTEMIHLFENLYPSTSGYTVKWVDEIRIYTGGYNGTADLLPKSYQSKMDETDPAPPATTPSADPGIVLTVSAGLAGCSILRIRGRI